MGRKTAVNFTNGFGVTNAGGKIVVDGSGFVHMTGNETIAGDKTLSGNTSFTGTTAVNNATTTATASSISTGNGLTSGQAFNSNTGNSTFSTGTGSSAGFFYGGADNSYAGANTFLSTGNFTGTLVALTADQTTAGTILGISAKNLTTGKAIDVSLGTLYSGTTDAVGGYTIGAVNVRAQSFTGNVFNVSASGAASSTGNLANLSSNQLAGNVLNVQGNGLTTGTAINVSATGLTAAGKAVSVAVGTAGTPIYVSTAGAGYAGNLIDLQANGASRFSVNQAGTLTLAGNLLVRGGTITGPTSGTFAIDNGSAAPITIGGATATSIDIGRSGQAQNLLGNATVSGNLGVNGNSPSRRKVQRHRRARNTTVAWELGVTVTSP